MVVAPFGSEGFALGRNGEGEIAGKWGEGQGAGGGLLPAGSVLFP